MDVIHQDETLICMSLWMAFMCTLFRIGLIAKNVFGSDPEGTPGLQQCNNSNQLIN